MQFLNKNGRYIVKDRTGGVVASANSIRELSRPLLYFHFEGRIVTVWDTKKQRQVPEDVVSQQTSPPGSRNA
jgi:hypothetical protein